MSATFDRMAGAALAAVTATCSKRSRSECLTDETAPAFFLAHHTAALAFATLLEQGGTVVGPVVVKILSRAEFDALVPGFRRELVPVVLDDGEQTVVLGYDLDTLGWALDDEDARVIH